MTAPGIAPAGPDFVRLAQYLSDPDNPEQLQQRVQFLYNTALYQNWFQLEVMVKGQQKAVKFIPGHIWGADRANGPMDGARVCVIGKMPGLDEIRVGRNLVGKSGSILTNALEEAGAFDIGNWYVTNLLKFTHPAPHLSSALQNDWIKDCRPLLQMELRLVKPDFILCLGSEAGKELLGMRGAVNNSAGKVFDFEIPMPDGSTHPCKVMTCIHPAAVARSPDLRPQLDSSIRLFTRLVNGESVGCEEKDIQHIVVRTEEEAVFWLTNMIADTEHGGAVAVDCEWQGEYPEEPGSWLRTIQVSHRPKFALCLVMREKGGAPCLCTSEKVKELLRQLFCNTEHRHIRGIGHFYRADLPWLLHYGVDIKENFNAPADPLMGWEKTKREGGFDTGTAAHAVCETDDFKLEVLATRYTAAPRYDMALQQAKKDLCKELKIGADDLPGYGDIPDEILHPYACYDVDVTRRLYDVYNGVDDKPGLLDCDRYGNNSRMAFWITMRASPACAEMEETGLLVDMTRAKALLDSYRVAEARKYQELKTAIRWPDFNINSVFDVRELLFGHAYRRQTVKATGLPKKGSPDDALLLNLRPLKASGKDNKKSWEELEATGEAAQRNPATDRETLGILFHQTKTDEAGIVVGMLRDLRFISQLLKTTLVPQNKKSKDPVPVVDVDDETFEKGLLSYVCHDGRIRTHIFQNLETGRYASARPNLQNQSKRREADYARILGKDYLYTLRSMFVAAPGYVLIEADYVGAELAGMAWMSGDPTMIEHVRRAQLPEDHPDYYDIHSAVAVAAFRLNCPATKKGLASIGMAHLRVAAKNVVFGYAYGRGAAAIARQAKEEGVTITVEEAQALIDGLVRQYPMLPFYFDLCRGRVRHPGWMCNPFGRFRRFSQALDFKTEGDQQRQAMNYPIQSLVADAMSRALDHLYFLRDMYGLHYRIALQIHDAVILEVPVAEVDAVYDVVLPQCMTDRVPIYPTDLDGMVITGRGPYYLGIDKEVYTQWGERLTKEQCIASGIPVRFGKDKKK